MNKVVYILYGIIVISLFASCRNGKKEGKSSSDTTQTIDSNVTSITKEIKPTVNVYIENSASMDGYVEGVTEFEQTIYSYLSDIKNTDFADSLNLFYINSEIIHYGSNVADFIEKLEPTTFRQRGGNRGTTDISNVFKVVLSETKENDVAILVTDGIFSPGKGKDAKQYLVNQQIGIKNTMVEHLKVFPNTAIIVYQLSSNFNGKYFNREDSYTRINATRPYYIWIIGDMKNIASLKNELPDTTFKGSGVQYSYTLFPSLNESDINYQILSNPKIGSFDRDKKTPQTSIKKIKKASKGVNKGKFMFSIRMDLSPLRFLLGDEYLMNTENYARLINKEPNNDYCVEIELNTNPNVNFTHNMKLSTQEIVTGELEIILLNKMPEWVYDINDDEGFDIHTNDAINKTFGIKYLVEGIYEAYQMCENRNYLTMKFNLKK